MANNYLLYRHIRLDKNEPFYIGISDNYNRPFSKHSRNRYWKHIIKNTKYKVEIILDGLSRQEVEQKEIEFISLYGRKDLGIGTLVNLTNGGTGGLGLKHTNETKSKMKGRIPYNRNKLKCDIELIKTIQQDYIPYQFGIIKLSKKYGIPTSTIERYLKVKLNGEAN